MSHYDPELHHRRSIRLQGYDYDQCGAYFVTICTHNRECLFGEIVGATESTPIPTVGATGRSPEYTETALNEFGNLVQEEWLRTAMIRSEIRLGEYAIMPNHLHAIVSIIAPPRTGDRPVAPTIVPTGPPPKSIGALIAGFKASVTKRINAIRKTPSAPVWQRNYYEHVIRDDADYTRIAGYVLTNPQRWQEDSLNPGNARVHINNVPGISPDARCRGDRPVAPPSVTQRNAAPTSPIKPDVETIPDETQCAHTDYRIRDGHQCRGERPVASPCTGDRPVAPTENRNHDE